MTLQDSQWDIDYEQDIRVRIAGRVIGPAEGLMRVSGLEQLLDYPVPTSFSAQDVQILLGNPDGDYTPTKVNNFFETYHLNGAPGYHRRTGYGVPVEIYMGYGDTFAEAPTSDPASGTQHRYAYILSKDKPPSLSATVSDWNLTSGTRRRSGRDPTFYGEYEYYFEIPLGSLPVWRILITYNQSSVISYGDAEKIIEDPLFAGKIIDIDTELEPPTALVTVSDISQDYRKKVITDVGYERHLQLMINRDAPRVRPYYDFPGSPVSEGSIPKHPDAEQNPGLVEAFFMNTNLQREYMYLGSQLRTQGFLNKVAFYLDYNRGLFLIDNRSVNPDDNPNLIFKDCFRYRRLDRLIRDLISNPADDNKTYYGGELVRDVSAHEFYRAKLYTDPTRYPVPTEDNESIQHVFLNPSDNYRAREWESAEDAVTIKYTPMRTENPHFSSNGGLTWFMEGRGTPSTTGGYGFWTWRHAKDMVTYTTSSGSRRFEFIYGIEDPHYSDYIVRYDVDTDTYRSIGRSASNVRAYSNTPSWYVNYWALETDETNSFMLGTVKAPAEESFPINTYDASEDMNVLSVPAIYMNGYTMTRQNHRVQLAMPYKRTEEQTDADTNTWRRITENRLEWKPDNRRGFQYVNGRLYYLATENIPVGTTQFPIDRVYFLTNSQLTNTGNRRRHDGRGNIIGGIQGSIVPGMLVARNSNGIDFHHAVPLSTCFYVHNIDGVSVKVFFAYAYIDANGKNNLLVGAKGLTPGTPIETFYNNEPPLFNAGETIEADNPVSPIVSCSDMIFNPKTSILNFVLQRVTEDERYYGELITLTISNADTYENVIPQGSWQSLTYTNGYFYAINNGAVGPDDKRNLHIFQLTSQDVLREVIPSGGRFEMGRTRSRWRSLTANGTTLYAINDATNELWAVDVSDHNAISKEHIDGLSSGSWDNLAWYNNRLYSVSRQNRLHEHHITTNQGRQEVNTVALGFLSLDASITFESLVSYDGFLYGLGESTIQGSTTFTLYKIDVSRSTIVNSRTTFATLPVKSITGGNELRSLALADGSLYSIDSASNALIRHILTHGTLELSKRYSVFTEAACHPCLHNDTTYYFEGSIYHDGNFARETVLNREPHLRVFYNTKDSIEKANELLKNAQPPAPTANGHFIDVILNLALRIPGLFGGTLADIPRLVQPSHITAMLATPGLMERFEVYPPSATNSLALSFPQAFYERISVEKNLPEEERYLHHIMDTDDFKNLFKDDGRNYVLFASLVSSYLGGANYDGLGDGLSDQAVGHLIAMDECVPIDHGQAWRSAYVNPEEPKDRTYGYHYGCISNLVSSATYDGSGNLIDEGSIHFVCGYKPPEVYGQTTDQKIVKENMINNWQWIQFGREINYKLPLLNTNGRNLWDLLQNLAQLANATVGFNAGYFEFKPRTDAYAVTKVNLGSEMGDTDPNTNTHFNQLTLDTIAGLDYKKELLIRSIYGSEIVRINAEPTVNQGAGTTTIHIDRAVEEGPFTHDAGSHIYPIDDYIMNQGSRRNIKSLKIEADYAYIANKVKCYYGNNQEYTTEDETSILAFGEQLTEFNFTGLLDDHQHYWAEEICRQYLEQNHRASYYISATLRYSPHLQLGSIVAVNEPHDRASLQWMPCRVLNVRHNYSKSETYIYARTFPPPPVVVQPIPTLTYHAETKTYTAPDGSTVDPGDLVSGHETLEAEGLPGDVEIDHDFDVRNVNVIPTPTDYTEINIQIDPKVPDATLSFSASSRTLPQNTRITSTLQLQINGSSTQNTLSDYQLSVTGLPDGLTMSEHGLVTGTPTKAGVYTAKFYARHYNGHLSGPLEVIFTVDS